jgi:hypothetical protein
MKTAFSYQLSAFSSFAEERRKPSASGMPRQEGKAARYKLEVANKKTKAES